MNYDVLFSNHFEKELKKLKKKYRNIGSDLTSLIATLQNGELVGTPIPECYNKLYKTRVKSTDMKKGKSGSYRTVYYVIYSSLKMHFLTIYTKNQKENITKEELEKIIELMGLPPLS